MAVVFSQSSCLAVQRGLSGTRNMKIMRSLKYYISVETRAEAKANVQGGEGLKGQGDHVSCLSLNVQQASVVDPK